MNWNNMSALAAVTLLVLAALAPMAVSAEPANLDSSAPNNADAGDKVTVSFSLTNTGDNESAYILNVDQIPDDWEIVDREDDGGTYKESNTRWAFQTIKPGETKNPSLTFKIPDDEDPGSYTVSAEAKDNEEGVRDTTSETINVQGDETPTPTDPDDDMTPTDPDDDDETPAVESPSETPDGDDGISTFLIVFVVLIVVAAAAAAAYYFLVVQE